MKARTSARTMCVILLTLMVSLCGCADTKETVTAESETVATETVATEEITTVVETVTEEVTTETVTEPETEEVTETETETVTESATESASKADAETAAPKTYADGFDPEYYAANNPDVVSAYGSNADALYNHYLNHGKAEGRQPNADAAASASASAPAQAAQTGQYNTTDGQPPYVILEFGYNADGTVKAAGGPTNLKSITDSDIPVVLNAIQAVLPTGTQWSMEKTYNWLGDTNGDGIPATQQACGAFAFYVQDAIFGRLPATQDIEGELTFRLYDVVYLFDLYGGHGGFITGIDNTNRTITVAEGGLNGKVRWGGVYSFNDIVGVVTRY